MYLARQACLFTSLLLCGAAHAQIDTLIGGTVSQGSFATRYALSTANPANLAFVLDPAGSGRTVLKTVVRNAEGTAGAIKRTDYYPKNESRTTGLRWYGISVYVPSTWTVHPNPTVIAQIDTSATATNLAAPLSLLVRGAALELNLNSNYLAPTSATASNSTSEVLKLGPLVTNRWYCLVVRSDWQPALGTGAITMWMNGEKVYHAINSNNSYFGVAHTPRTGLMFPGLMGVTERTLYSDFIRLGGPTTTALQMYQISPCSSFVNGSNIQW
ncbi:heparin lyase I family protein [Pseudoduganella namucuonensis]|uniref:Polysaccharide lyase n=1 Tax=Pseudoduganella namucuonensis TaxID=1035707 RepID=A0A1I7I0X5_9BURK|nr:heparin lyase I family protein [Pseudoduganella namucuonensis]SFU66619.1 Polysaccharide lyase [Pseudoduganella namucuonensis]